MSKFGLCKNSQLTELLAETIALVELHMPEIDTLKVKQSLEAQDNSWEPSVGLDSFCKKENQTTL